MALTQRQLNRKQWLETTLDTIQARINGDLDSGAVSLSLNGRSLQRYSLDELNRLYKQYDHELSQLENQVAGKSKYSAVRVRF